MPQDFATITALLDEVNAGSEDASKRLVDAIYNDLHQAAHWLMRVEVRPGGAGATLQTTALVHEGFLRLIENLQEYDSSRHFFNSFKMSMRRFLVDYIRAWRADKRGGNLVRVTLDAEGPTTNGASDIDAVDLIDVLEKLAQQDPQTAELAHLILIYGLTQAQAAKSVGIALATVERRWRFFKAWIRRELGGGHHDAK